MPQTGAYGMIHPSYRHFTADSINACRVWLLKGGYCHGKNIALTSPVTSSTTLFEIAGRIFDNGSSGLEPTASARAELGGRLPGSAQAVGLAFFVCALGAF